MADALVTRLKPLVRPCMVLEPAKGLKDSPTASRFGGVPYLGPGETWPVCGTCKKRLSFISQGQRGRLRCGVAGTAGCVLLLLGMQSV